MAGIFPQTGMWILLDRIWKNIHTTVKSKMWKTYINFNGLAASHFGNISGGFSLAKKQQGVIFRMRRYLN